jgi:hypothetical protein
MTAMIYILSGLVGLLLFSIVQLWWLAFRMARAIGKANRRIWVIEQKNKTYDAQLWGGEK